MGLRNIQRVTGWVVLGIGLAVLLSVPAQAQDTQEREEGLSWYEKFTTSEGVQQQYLSGSGARRDGLAQRFGIGRITVRGMLVIVPVPRSPLVPVIVLVPGHARCSRR